jgi:hypothetical protein
MSATPRPFKVPSRLHDCWDWLTPEDVCRHALAAVYLARDAMKPPVGERFVDATGLPWADREVFCDNLMVFFELRVKTEGYQLGINQYWVKEAKELQRWQGVAASRSLNHTEVSTTRANYGPQAHDSEAEAPRLQHGQHLKADPAGSAPDAVNRPSNLAQTTPRALKSLSPPVLKKLTHS